MPMYPDALKMSLGMGLTPDALPADATTSGIGSSPCAACRITGTALITFSKTSPLPESGSISRKQTQRARRMRHGASSDAPFTSSAQSARPRSRSLTLVLLRVLASTCLTITAQYSECEPSLDGSCAGHHHAVRRHRAVADFAGGAVVDAGALAEEHAHADHAVVADHEAFHHFRTRADEAMVFDDGRAGLQRLRARHRCRHRRTGGSACRSARTNRPWPRYRPWCLRRRRRRCW